MWIAIRVARPDRLFVWHAQSAAVGVGIEENVSSDSPRP